MSILLIRRHSGDKPLKGKEEESVMNDLSRGERLQIMLTKEELESLDNWRFARRMPSRAAAIRELLKRGLAAEGFTEALGGSKSEDFGVTGQSSPSPTRDRRGSKNES